MSITWVHKRLLGRLFRIYYHRPVTQYSGSSQPASNIMTWKAAGRSCLAVCLMHACSGALSQKLTAAHFFTRSSHDLRCGDLTLATLRSRNVLHNFTSTQLGGFWYEQAFSDIAQAGATCPTLNATHHTDGEVSMQLAVKYGKVPFEITELYQPSEFIGGFIKTAQVPGGSLLKVIICGDYYLPLRAC